jgi:hypothetical protein
MSAGWTYGAEFELADLDRRKPTLEGFGWDKRDVTMVNSNGIAVDPRGELYGWGGEINTPACKTVKALGECLRKVREHYPEARTNYRTNLHIHVRVPGLKDDLDALKQLLMFTSNEIRTLLPIVEPIPEPIAADYRNNEAYKGARKRYARRKVSHQTTLPMHRVSAMLNAKTVEEFFLAEFHLTDKRFAYIQPRAAVNIRQLQETDTIEFRHFPMTLNSEAFENAATYCKAFLLAALGLSGGSINSLYKVAGQLRMPQFDMYDHALEQRFLLTVRTNKDAAQNIATILKEDNVHAAIPPSYRRLYGQP